MREVWYVGLSPKLLLLILFPTLRRLLKPLAGRCPTPPLYNVSPRLLTDKGSWAYLEPVGL